MIGFVKEESEGMQISLLSFSELVPVTVAEVKSELNFSGSTKDTEIARMITSAVRQIELYTGKTIVEKTYHARWNELGKCTRLMYDPIIEVDSVVTGDTTLQSSDYFLRGYYLHATAIYGSITYNESYSDDLQVTYSAGMLLTASATSDTVTRANHGYSNGDTVKISGFTGTADGSYTVANATTNTFEIGTTITGDGFIGILDPVVKEAIILQSAENFLRGEGSTGIVRKAKNMLSHIREEQAW